jgi:uncharacterized PurR-regulated membrane protein YhhQ (DUF165 family)
MNRPTQPEAVAAWIAYLSSIPAANWMIGHIGTVQFPGGPHVIPVGFGYDAPSGVLLIGVALVARDIIHRTLGHAYALGAIVAGVAISMLVSPAIAVASAAAFGLGELADYAVYSPLQRRHLVAAVLASGAVGAVVDSLVFLQLAFGATTYWEGNTLGKIWMSVAAAAILTVYRRAVPVRLHTPIN